LLWRCFSHLILSLAATANTIAASGRARRVRRDVDCDFPYKKCAIPGLEGSYECVDTQSNAESCGACAESGGMDCTSIPKALAADCIHGSCVIRMSSLAFITRVACSCLHPRFLCLRLRYLGRPQVMCTEQLPPLYR